LTLESELVSGFMTEHAAVIFVFFFLAEYASIVLICILTSLLFLGGYMYDYEFLANLAQYIDFDYYLDIIYNNYILYYNPLFEGLAYGLSLGLKTSIMIFIFIWVRASFPRIRFDQLMSFCWTVLLPIVIALIIIVPCILDSFEILPADISLLSGPFMVKKDIFNKINKRFYSSYRPKTRTLGHWLIVVLAVILHGLLVSPPKPHAFVSIQLNSGFSFNWSLFKTKLKEKCTIQNFSILFITTLLGYSLKLYVSNRWGVELNDFCVYMSAYGVIGGSVKLVKSFLEGFEFVKDSNTLKMSAMSANGGNIPTGVGGGNNAPQGPAGPANNPPQAQAGPANNPPQAQAGPVQWPAAGGAGANVGANPLDVQPGYTIEVINPIPWPAGGTGADAPDNAVAYSTNRSNQPYASNMQDSMKEIASGTNGRCTMPDFDVNARRFFCDFINDKFPEKVFNNNVNYYNTRDIRKALKKLP